MEDFVREPVELTEFELDEVAGGGGCGGGSCEQPPPACHPCGPSIDVSLSLCVGIVL